MHNIYLGKRSVSLCSINEQDTKDPNSVIFFADNNFNFAIVPELLNNSPAISSIKIYVDENYSTYEAFDKLCSQFCQINAGGGLVRGAKGDYLLIYRYNIWDLPKGVQEENEELSQTALREVMEECSISDLALGNRICVTHHCYWRDGKFMLKHTHWYNMQYTGKIVPVPQQEESITNTRWVSPNELDEYVSDSYPSIKEVVKKALK